MQDEAEDSPLAHLPLGNPQERGFALDRILDAAVQDSVHYRLNELGRRMGLPALEWRWDFNVAREVTVTGRSPHTVLSDRARLDALAWVEALKMREISEPFDGLRWAYSQVTYWEMRVEWVVDVEAWQFALAAREEAEQRAELQVAIFEGWEAEYFETVDALERIVRAHPGISSADIVTHGIGAAWLQRTGSSIHRMLEVMHRAARIQEGPADRWWPVTAGESGPPFRQPVGRPLAPTENQERQFDQLRDDGTYERRAGGLFRRAGVVSLESLDERFWKLIGGDRGGTRSVYFASEPHTILDCEFISPEGGPFGYDKPIGWSAYVRVGTDEILRKSFPEAHFGHDDVPARAAVHALAMYYWRARQGTHPRWSTVDGALRFLKPDLTGEQALESLDNDIALLVHAWEILAREPRGIVDPAESADIRTITDLLDED